jgi:hypothetical protein
MFTPAWMPPKPGRVSTGNLIVVARSKQKKNLELAETSNAEKWVQYLSAIAFSARGIRNLVDSGSGAIHERLC